MSLNVLNNSGGGCCGGGHHAEVPEVTPRDLKEEMKTNKELFVLDVREPDEWKICHLDGAQLVPLGDLPDRIHELDRSRDIVVHCRSGRRSLDAAEFLIANGFTRVRNLTGGILRWADEVDPSLQRY